MKALRLNWWFFIGFILSISLISCVSKAVDGDPVLEGQSMIWQSDGTGSGDDGDIMIKITAGGTTKTITLVDFSAY